uniref:CSON002713 protein n=1 Tax=Culicoides sonorensis TaxID=179676 RepID=A0A336MPE5_CULSO
MNLFKKLPQLSHCCCYIQLRKGTIVLGIFQLIGSITVLIILLSIANCNFKEMLQIQKIKSEHIEMISSIVEGLRVGCLYLSSSGIILSTFLLFGAIKNRAIWIKIYLISNAIILIFAMIAVTAFLFYTWHFAIYLSVITSIEYYLFLCVKSFYQQLIQPKIDRNNVEFHRRGAIILGLFQLIGSIVNTGTAVLWGLSDLDYAEIFKSYDLTAEQLEKVVAILESLRIGLLIFSIGGIIFASCLIIGSIKNRILFVKIYLIIYVFILIFAFTGLVILLFYSWNLALSTFFVTCIDIYLFICVNSYYQELIKVENPKSDIEFEAVASNEN